MGLYLKYMMMGLRSQLIYRTSFILMCIGQFFVPFFIFIGLYLMFDRFDSLVGWTFGEVALLYGTIHMAFALAEALVRGFDSFPQLVKSGEFDRLLLRPVSTPLQVVGWKLEFTRIGRLLQGVLIFVWALSSLTIQWTVLKVICITGMVIGGFFIFSGLFIFFAAMAFWTIEGLEIANIFTDGGREMSQYPLTIYAKSIQRFFTFIVPFGVINTIPLNYLLDKQTLPGHFTAFIPYLGILFLLPALLFWNYGVKHYQSTGS